MSLFYQREFILTLAIILTAVCFSVGADTYSQRIMTLSGIYAIAAVGYHPVSYTHQTLPTSDLV